MHPDDAGCQGGQLNKDEEVPNKSQGNLNPFYSRLYKL
jgi:hypothetical protein